MRTRIETMYRVLTRRRVLAVSAACCAILAGAVVYLRDPADGGYPVCVFYGLTHLECPGCGTLRALHQLTHGNLAQALQYNPLTVAAVPLMAGFWLGEARIALGAGPQQLEIPVGRMAWAIPAGIAAFWVLRNLW